MKEKVRGGIETIIAVIIIIGIVVALIISVIIPIARGTNDLGHEGTAGLLELQEDMGYTKN